MSHEDAARRSAGEASRRKVKFQAVIEDLEGRVLLSSGGYQIRAPYAHMRVARTPRVRVQLPRLRMRQLQLASLRQGQTINVTPTINVQNNVPVTPAATTPTTGTTTPATPTTVTPQGSTGQAWPAVVAPSSGSSGGSTSSNSSTSTPAAGSSSTGTTTNTGSQSSGSTGTSSGSTGTSSGSTTTTPTTTPPAPAPPSFAEGVMLINSQTGEIAQYSGGTRHLISPPVATKMGLTAGQLTAVTADKFSLIPPGQDYFPDGMFLRNAQTGEISRFSGDSFHWVSVPVATKLGLTGNDVVTITAEQYNKVHKSTQDYFQDGMLIQNVQTGEVDLYSGGQRHWISVPVATKMNITAAQVTTISASQFNQVPQGGDYFPEGSYLQNQANGEISVYSGGYNHVISTPVAVVMGLTQANLISVSQGQYSNIPQGGAYYPEGIFLQNNASGEVSQFAGGQRHIVSPQAIATLGLTSAKVAAIGADQYNALPLGGDYVPPTTTTSQA